MSSGMVEETAKIFDTPEKWEAACHLADIIPDVKSYWFREFLRVLRDNLVRSPRVSQVDSQPIFHRGQLSIPAVFPPRDSHDLSPTPLHSISSYAFLRLIASSYVSRTEKSRFK